jgi:hypothetical protein
MQAPQSAGELLEKYEQFVWYARKPRDDYGKVTMEVARKYMPNTPVDILQGMVAGALRVETTYPEEVARLNDDDPNMSSWAHGFNSGMLAALRMVPASTKIPARALAEFPELST